LNICRAIAEQLLPSEYSCAEIKHELVHDFQILSDQAFCQRVTIATFRNTKKALYQRADRDVRKMLKKVFPGQSTPEETTSDDKKKGKKRKSVGDGDGDGVRLNRLASRIFHLSYFSFLLGQVMKRKSNLNIYRVLTIAF